MAQFESCGTIINQAALELGLGKVGDPYTAVDQNFLQLVGLFQSAGRDLVQMHHWPHLTAEKVIVTTPGTVAYALPSDFLDMIDQSGWNRTTRFPLGGPLTPQEWQYLKASVVGVTFNVLFRLGGILPVVDAVATLVDSYVQNRGFRAGDSTATITGVAPAAHTLVAYAATDGVVSVTLDGVALPDTYLPGASYNLAGGLVLTLGGTTWFAGDYFNYTIAASVNTDGGSLECFPSPQAAITIAFEYRSRNWVRCVDLTSKDAPVVSADIALFDTQLLQSLLKLRWREAKGFDTVAVKADFDERFKRAKDQMAAAPRLSLVNGGRIRERYLDGATNTPISGFGS